MTICNSKDLLLEYYAPLRTKNVEHENVNQKLMLEMENLNSNRKGKNMMSQAQLELEEKVKEIGKEIFSLSNKNEALSKELDQTKDKIIA